ncbi:MAG: hypothetical protein F2712_02400 [Actinobacteria bacterium]|uniref:Unannotated protein n=1 Tax=freshwater metagenome TaxID=449393 RepID=A0A6J6UCR8_9ZZZZ|nr:hypothetical protein [Actinomycetota bacterium]
MSDTSRETISLEENFFKGFPWGLALVLYSLSWAWPLLRPNTLFWDDWVYIFNQPKSFLNQIFNDTGLPPWRAVLDQELLAVGYWTIPWLTFAMYFAAGAFLWEILKKTKLLTTKQAEFVVLIFLIAPVNHARIALVMFGYTTSYFFFFLAWMLLIRSRSNAIFVVSIFCFFWSFMTHSFLFFFIFPTAHFIFLCRDNLLEYSKNKIDLLKIFILLLLPIVYLWLRYFLWRPTEEYKNYHKVSIGGAQLGFKVIVVGLTMSLAFVLISRKSLKLHPSAIVFLLGSVLFTFGLFPYFANSNFPDVISVFAFRNDWGSRHLLLSPLGISFVLCGTWLLIPIQLRKMFFTVAIAVCSLVNIFSGSQYYLDALKKDQLIELFAANKDINPRVTMLFVDETKIFNGRGSTYRTTELSSLLLLSGRESTVITGKGSCNELPKGAQFILKSNKNFLSALTSRDLGLYFEVSPCSDILTNNP